MIRKAGCLKILDLHLFAEQRTVYWYNIIKKWEQEQLYCGQLHGRKPASVNQGSACEKRFAKNTKGNAE
jgi:hypothetical protein